MDLTGIGSILDIGSKIIDRVWPDPAQRDAAKLELFKAQQAGEFKAADQLFELARGQQDVNKVEAASTSLFVAGWRPFIGWICGAAFAFKFILGPSAVVLMAMAGHPITLPVFDFTEMSTILMGMLGLGTLRSFEKIKGVA
jgi:hypothetical protein